MNLRLDPAFLASMLNGAQVCANSDGKLTVRSCACGEESKAKCECHQALVRELELSDESIWVYMQCKLRLPPARRGDIPLLKVHQKLLAFRNLCLRVIARIDRELADIERSPSAYTPAYGLNTLKICKQMLRGK